MLNIDAIHLREINMPLAHPFETSFGLTTGRRILLIELESDGLSAWGECVAGEHPYFSDETIDTAWIITENELAPRLLDAELLESGGSCPGVFNQVRGHRMAKAALENAVWDLEAQAERVSLAKLARRHSQGNTVRGFDRHPVVAGEVDGQDRPGGCRGLPAHQAED